MARRKYSCDFETTTKPEDCRVWAYGWMEIGKKQNFEIGNNIDDFMIWIEQSQGDCYFHNLRFDGSFIVNWLLKNGFEWSKSGKANTFHTIISSMGQWYIIDICYGYKGKDKLHTRIYDSLKKLPFTVAQIGQAFNLNVLKIDKEQEFYTRHREVGHQITDEEYDYIKNDLEVVADALKVQFDQGLKYMTSGSDSLNGFKSVISRKMFKKLFPVITLEENEEIRWCYRGGFTWLNERFAEKDIGEGMVFDVNSLYPSQMYSRPLPYGYPIKFAGKYVQDDAYPLYTQHMRCEFSLKKDRIPIIQLKNNVHFRNRQNEYLKHSDGEIVDLYVTNIDLELIKEHYDLYHEEYIGGWKFRQKIGIFNDFIDKWMYIKTHSSGAIKTLAKLMLNSLYGKFATNPKVTGKIPELKEDGSNRLVLPRDKETGKVIDEFKDPVYTPMGVFITSWARYTTITTAQKCFDRIIYCDTDSIHITGTEIPEAIKDLIDPDKLGYWKHEGNFQRARFLRQKTYIEEMILNKPKYVLDKVRGRVIQTNKELHVVCAGMPDRIKKKVTFGNFHVGFSSYGKLLPKQVSGGVVLKDTEFTIN